MTPYYERNGITVYHGDCREVVPLLNAVTAILTDPPYGLSFMGRAWDHGIPGVQFWQAAMLACLPGAALLAFGGSRTYHRLACAIEDASWEVRDCLMWVYGSGFPKSHDVSKAIDKEAGAVREIVGRKPQMGGVVHKPNGTGWDRPWQSEPDAADRLLNITAPSTDAATLWNGYGSALKPAYEPIILARKPLDGTLANNALTHGCGGLNIDGCRVSTNGHENLAGGGLSSLADGWDRPWKHDPEAIAACKERGKLATAKAEELGRFPANLLHDGSDEVLALFPESKSPSTYTRATRSENRNAYAAGIGEQAGDVSLNYGDSGSAARFFYCAKASTSERTHNGTVENKHPTVKPLALMQYLVRLVKQPRDTLILDMFGGSGSTAVACIREGVSCIIIEQDAENCETIKQRCEAEFDAKPTEVQRDLFSGIIE